MNINWIWYLGLGYLLGSIPFALVIGKLFYKTDVRNYGSGNLGGTNAGRVLGKKAGISVIVCDVLKVVVAVGIVSCFDQNASIWAGFAAAFGHCYPIFAGFRGGKAVSVAIGYALVTNVYAFVIALVIFFITLKLTKYVSLASILGSATIVVIAPFIGYSTVGIITNACIVGLLVYKHKANIKRIKAGTENKITWM